MPYVAPVIRKWGTLVSTFSKYLKYDYWSLKILRHSYRNISETDYAFPCLTMYNKKYNNTYLFSKYLLRTY